VKKFLLSTAIFFSLSASAFAADAVLSMPPAGFVWTGGYVGLQAGYGWGDSYLDVITNDNYGNPDPDGFIGGVYGGYNYQFSNNIVLGADLDFNYSDIDGDGEGLDGTGAPFGGVNINADLKWAGSARVRVGYAMDRFLPYIAGGVAFGRYEVTVNDNGTVERNNSTMTGWTLGAGVEYAFTDDLIGRVEYRYTDYGHDRFSDFYNVDLKTNEVRIGLAYKF
jgi:outer membrane immunogenic protein